jgi:hypothetical protein
MSFIYKAAKVALRLAQANRLREGSECLGFLMEPLVSQGLQEAYFNHVSPALANCRSLEHGLQAL